MKAVGFTPGQVVAILLVQVVVPVAAGALAGAGLGLVGSISTVERLTRAFGLPAAFSASLPLVVVVVVASIGLAILAAIGPAIGAGRISAVQAISIGSARANGARAGRLRRISLRLPISLPARLGLAAGLAHPVRASMTLGALIVGVAAVTFAVSLNLSLLRVMTQLDRAAATPVRAQVAGDPSIAAGDVTAAIAANPETDRYIPFGAATVSTRGLRDITFVGYDGDAGWIGYELIEGRWISGPGEVVAPTKLIRDAHFEIGDVLELTGPGGSTTVRLVGETFESGDDDANGLVLRGDWADLTAVEPGADIDAWEILPDEGIAPAEYASWLRTATNGGIGAYTLDDSTAGEEFLLFLSVVALMGAVLVATSLGGVFNTVLLETRHRTRELAVLKALGFLPRQVVAMVVSTVVPVGLIAGLLGVPIGLLLQRAVLGYMAETAAESGLPDSTFDVLSPPVFVALALAGLAMAALGAFLPGQRAARLPIAPVLQAE
jgi:putative ABC transport system permease protein